MKIITQPLSVDELKQMAKEKFGNLVKAVVDVEKKIMAVDAELHADAEALLVENGSRQPDLWGINIYPDLNREDWIEFDSMINLKPGQGNKSRDVENEATKRVICVIVDGLIKN
jgi:hypothetical protein